MLVRVCRASVAPVSRRLLPGTHSDGRVMPLEAALVKERSSTLRRRPAHSLDGHVTATPVPDGAVCAARTRTTHRFQDGLPTSAAPCRTRVGFQVLLALGAPWGSAAYGGGAAGPDGVLSSGLRAASAVAAVILGVSAWVILARADLMPRGPLSPRLLRWAAWTIVAFMVLNTLSNLSSSNTVERWVLGGTTVVLVFLCGYVAFRAPGQG
jgi:hypothetical protein